MLPAGTEEESGLRDLQKSFRLAARSRSIGGAWQVLADQDQRGIKENPLATKTNTALDLHCISRTIRAGHLAHPEEFNEVARCVYVSGSIGSQRN